MLFSNPIVYVLNPKCIVDLILVYVAGGFSLFGIITHLKLMHNLILNTSSKFSLSL